MLTRVRRRARRGATAMAAAGALTVPGAHAHQAPQRTWDGTAWSVNYPNQRPANDPILSSVYSQAQAFWNKRNVQSPGATTLYAADAFEDPNATAGGRAISTHNGYKDNGIVLHSYALGGLLEKLRGTNRKRQREALKILYTTLAHEEGHVRGLPHNKEGLMYELNPTTPGDWRPLMKQLRKSGLVPKPTYKPRKHRR